jgi:GDP-4-dehydro-6-deoxy-D-mannose reductase
LRIYVTGVTGFLGRHLAAELLARGHAVAGSALEQAPVPEGVELHTVPLAQPRELRQRVRGFAPDRVVHLAGLAHVGQSWKRMPEYFQVNVLGTEAVLDAAEAVPVLLASSAEVYGVVPEAEQPLGEERAPAPASPYALTKAAAERLVLRAGGVVVRLFNLIGPGQGRGFALPAFAGQLAAIAAGRQPARLGVGNLEARRDFVHVLDGAEAFALLAERGAAGGVYNVASGSACSIREALDRLLAVSGVAAEIVLDERYLRPVDIPLLRGSAEPLRALGWEPRRGVDRAVADLWRWSVESAVVEAGP